MLKLKIIRERVTKPVRACFYCGATDREMTKDHVIPKAHGGTKARENMVDCCMICNRVKGCMTAEQFIQWAKDIVKLHGGKR